MSKRTFTIFASYALALILVLGIFSLVSYRRLNTYRLASKYGSMLAFEETVGAVDRMSQALGAGVYATDGSMCSSICSRVYAEALAAEAAMSTLPFATHELEEIARYINQVGDYAYTLSSEAAQEGFTKENVEDLRELSKVADGLKKSLRELQSSVNNGSVLLDRRERDIINVDVDESVGLVSGEFARFEEEFPHRSNLVYDGKYSYQEKEHSAKSLSDAQTLAMAARYAGVSPGEMKVLYEYEDGGKCYGVGELRVLADSRGVESMTHSRLVSESKLSMDKARHIAKSFLEKQGFESFQQTAESQEGGLARFSYAAVQDGVLLPDREMHLTVALDDGSIYGFSRDSYSEEKVHAQWSISAEQAAQTLPESLMLKETDRVILQSEGGNDLPCYRLICENEQGQNVTIYVDALSGKQSRIEL